MVATSCVPSMAGTSNTDQSKMDYSNLVLAKSSVSVMADPRVEGLKDSTLIRIMVELNEMPVIDYAIQRGVGLEQLDAATVKKVETQIGNTLNEVKNDMEENNIKVDIINEFNEVFSGFSTETTIKNAKEIENLPNVKRVYISTKYFLPKPQMNTSNDIINTKLAWDLGFKGQGQLIAVLDTSFAPDHQDMQKISEPGLAKIKSAEALPAGLPGTWRNIKMPYAYNYYDNTQNLPAISNHGTHVSGTVGANGDVDKGGIKGVAPEAQILGMKVFGDDPDMPTTFDDIYVRAIEDSLKLGADGINMSLGSTASFVQDESDDPARVAIRKAAESGVVVAISAGNSDRFGSGFDDPLASNPDTGVVGSPSLNPYSLSVASIENSHMKTEFALATADGVEGKIPYSWVKESPNPIDVTSGHAVEVVYVGTGEQKYYDGKNVAGKFVLAVRTGVYYYAMVKDTAQANGALGVLVRGTEAHGDYVKMNVGTTLNTIPIMSVSIANGNKYEALLKEGKSVTVQFNGGLESIPSATAGQMSDFTSWGVTPNLDFKPEITAPGGNIYSTEQNGTYGVKDGTSMASPHVAGAVAVLSQRIKADFPAVSGLEKYLLTKNLLMSTAKPLWVAGEDTYTSPRRQGAGVMDLYAATSGHVVITDPTTKVSKVLLKEIGDDVKFTVEVKNYAQKNITYTLDTSIGMDYAYKGKLVQRLPNKIDNTQIKCEKDGQAISEITVTTGSAITFDVSFNLKNAVDPESGKSLKEICVNGNFVEGFIRLNSQDDLEPSIGLPYLGFYGNWGDAPVLDTSATWETFYELPNGLCTGVELEKGTIVSMEGEKAVKVPFEFRGKNTDITDLNSYFSPNKDGSADDVRAFYTFLRNAKELNVNILDENKAVVRELVKDKYIPKNYFGGNKENPQYYAKENWIWDGVINNKVAPEGQYYYEIKTKADGENTQYQTTVLPMIVDVTNPVLDMLAYDAKTGDITAHATDNIKFREYALLNGTTEVARNTTGVFNIEKLKVVAPYQLSVVALDEAMNKVSKVVMMGVDNDAVKKDKVAPVFVTVPSPQPLDKFNTSEISFEGTIKEEVGLKNIIINGVDVSFDFDAVKKVYTFKTDIKLADGKHDVNVTAIDFAGNKTEFSRIIFVDTVAPEIVVNQITQNIVNKDVTSTVLFVKFTDNYTGLNVYVNGNLDKSISVETSYVKLPKAVVYEMSRKVNLVEGVNTFVIKATDNAKNEKELIWTVTRKKADKDDKEDSKVVSSSPTTSPTTSTAPAPAPTTTPPLVEVVADQSVIKVKPSDVKTENGKATVEITKEQINVLVEQMKKSKDGNVINLDFTSIKDSKVQIDFPIGILKDMKQNQITVKFEGAKVEIPVDLTKVGVVDEKLIIGMTKVATDSIATKQNNKTIAAYTFDIKSANSALTGKMVAKINLATVTVNKDKLVLASVDANGKIVILGNKVKDNMISGNIEPNQQVVLLERNISFKDTSKHWATKYVESMAAKDVVAESLDNNFNPEKKVTRAEFTTMLVKTLGVEVTLGQSSFKDVKSTEWFVAYVETAKTQGIISGATDLFKPNDKITRAEMAVMLSKALKLSMDSPVNATGSNSDVPNWAKTAVEAVKKDGLMNGDGKTFRANDKTTRAEAITVIYKLFNK